MAEKLKEKGQNLKKRIRKKKIKKRIEKQKK